MMGKPPPRPGEAARKRDPVELRIVNLHRELVAETEPSTRAAILYQVAALYEHELKHADEAIEHYSQAHLAEPGFQPALIAQLRLAERSQNGHAVNAVRSALVANARSPAIGASALMDFALHSEDWLALLRESIARSPEPVVPALLLEWMAEARGDKEALRYALRIQAEHATEASLAAALWLDVALSEIDAGCPDAAIDALERATGADALMWPARSLQLRIAREHGRWEVFVRAATAMALFLEATVDDAALDPLDLSVPVKERLPMAAFLWQEAATCSELQLQDAPSAIEYANAALRLYPEQGSTRLQVLRLLELLGDDSESRIAADWFRNNAPGDPAFVAHEIRRAISSDQELRAVEILREAAARYPGSELAQAALDVALIRNGASAERVERLRAQAVGAESELQARCLWHAAQLSASDPRNVDGAQSLYGEAIAAGGSSNESVTREALGAAIAAKEPQRILARSHELMDCEIEEAERATLEFSRYDATQHILGANQEAQLLLRDAIEEPRNRDWAPQVARARAAWAGNDGLLARSHEALAGLTTGDTALGHLGAAGEAYARNQDWEAAEQVLRRALQAAPEDRYILSLLDGVLREGGRPEEVVSLARARSDRGSSSSLGEVSLLLAGATAEKSGNLDAARHAYEQALRENADSPSAALALLDIARRQNDTQVGLRAYDFLSRSGLGGGVAELFALLRGDALTRTGAPASERSAAYELALDHPDTALAAAVALLSMPTSDTSADQRSAAEEVLADAGALPETSTGRVAAAYNELRAALGQDDSSTGDAWLQLASLAPSGDLRAGACLHGLRARRIACGPGGADELFMLAQGAEDLTEAQPDAATAIDEALAPGDDPDARVHAIERKLAHCEALGRGALEAARSRALVEAERGAEAVELLSAAVEERHDDLALWETLRTAARQAQQWPLVAQACERLAPFVEGSLRADLLEEAGVVRLDCLAQHPQAEDLFRRALEEDPDRQVAFRRLHDLLAEQEDAEALEALISKRLALGGPKDRLDLLYERARLLRGFSDRPGALEVLDELFSSEPGHAGALALAAEVHVSLEQWAEAVDSLQQLCRANIPDEQRRVAHLGAADFLETHLVAKPEALAELRAVEALGLADADVWTRIASIEIELGNRGAAVDAYSRALDADPTNADAIARLVELLDQADKDVAVARYEHAIWARIDHGELDASLVRALTRSASWQGHLRRADAARAVERALGLAPEGEHRAPDLSHVPVAAAADRDADPLLGEVLRQAGPGLTKNRVRSKKASPSDPVYADLQQLSQRFGARVGSIGLSDGLHTMIASIGRNGEFDWLLPRTAQAGLDEGGRFVAGRVAWATPQGGAHLLDESPERVAGILAAILRAVRCELAPSGPSLPAAHVKLRRAVRKSVHELVTDMKPEPASLLAFAQSLQRSADRAGLLASGDIAASLRTLLGGRLSVEALKSSPRGLDLLRFWLDADSALWRQDGC